MRYIDETATIVRKYVFFEEKVKNYPIFRLNPSNPLGAIFVNDDFVQAAESSNLLGFGFEEIWSSDE